MFEKFTEGSIKVIMMAQEEGKRMGHNFVGTEQLLLGLVAQRHGIAARALRYFPAPSCLAHVCWGARKDSLVDRPLR